MIVLHMLRHMYFLFSPPATSCFVVFDQYEISSRESHATKTYGYASKEWALPPTELTGHGQLIPHRHYRLALDVIGRSLLNFRSSHELVRAVRDAIIGKLYRPNCK
jgi:hypothetical protein